MTVREALGELCAARIGQTAAPQIASVRPQVQTIWMAIHSFGQRKSADLKVRFEVLYADGQTASLVVSEETARHGSTVVMVIAHERQQLGELPAGTIESVKRVH
jgi:hypothetical protein